MNDENGSCLLVERLESNGIEMHRGEYNADTLDKEDCGIEYDEGSGVE